jgi:NosR/NirI family nitrous oxide reductase transcriptional regulator
MMDFRHINIAIALVLILGSLSLAGTIRFPPPEFESGYELPGTTTPGPREGIYEYIDTVVLLLALGLSSYLVLKKRRRKAIFALTVFSLIYFGFYRRGCICSIGAIQNIVLSFFDPGYAVPFVALFFFLLPLVFTLFFGRTFCAAVCPLGAIQDVVLLRPVSVPGWLENGLRLLAYIYLGAAVLFAATGSAFIICRYDPFVSFFRLSGNINVLILGACFLIVGVFVGRPYCRFICPYGVILRQLSRISKWRVTITPDECIKCRLCEDSCPFGAVKKPVEQWPAKEYHRSKKRLALLMVLLPILIFFGGWAGYALRTTTAKMHATVRLAERVRLEETGKVEGTTDASDAFRATGMETTELYDDASNIRARFGLGGWIFGGFVGLVIGMKLIGVSLWRQRTDYEADRASCLACGRCFEYCPREHLRRKSDSAIQNTTGMESDKAKLNSGGGR